MSFLNYIIQKETRSDNNCCNNNGWNTVSPYADSLLFGQYGKKSALGLSAFFAACNLISNSIAMMPVEVKQYKDGERTTIPNHKLAQLFYQMRLPKFNLIKMLVEDIILKGNAYLYIRRDQVGEPVGLTYLRPGQVTIDYNELSDVIRYQVTTNNKVTKKIIPADDMIHLFLHSNNGYSGQSILTYGSRVIDLANSTDSAAQEYFDSGCSIKGILQFKTRVPNDQKEKIRANWNQVHGSGGGASGLAVLEGDSEFLPVSQNTKESQMLETREFNITEVARLFNISPVLLGDLTHSSYNDIEAANTEFVSHTLLPWVEMFQNELSRKLMTRHKNMTINIDETVLLKGKMLDLANYITTLVKGGIITTNEGREILGLNKMENADKLFVAFTDINQNTINGTADNKTTTDEPLSNEPEDSSSNNK